MAKIKTITVSYPHFDDSKYTPQERNAAPRVYRIEKVTDSTEYVPGRQLSTESVEMLCADESWKVTAVPVK